MWRERLTALKSWDWEIAWALFAVANLVWMLEMPDWISPPFHFIWVSLTVLFGFRLWPDWFSWTVVSLVVASTGIVLLLAWGRGMAPDELLEIPLMFAMFLAMLLHTVRRRAAIVELQQVSHQNTRLLERQRAFVQNAAHELRTPITVALAHAELAQLTAPGEDVEVVTDELGRLRRLTDRLLLLATVEAADRHQPQLTDLGMLVAETARRWATTPRRWVIEAAAGVTVRADREQLVLALDALFDNAIKATEVDATIEVTVVRSRRTAMILVHDSGVGLEPGLQETMFERFRRGRAAPQAAGGFGLGLATVRSVVDAHGGSVSAANHRAGGAVMTIELPLAGPRPDPRGQRAYGTTRREPAAPSPHATAPADDDVAAVAEIAGGSGA